MVLGNIAFAWDSWEYKKLKFSEETDAFQKEAVTSCIDDFKHISKVLVSSTDLNRDGLMDVLLTIRSSYYCGSGGCYTNICINKGDKWDYQVNKMWGNGRMFLTGVMHNGFEVIMYESGCGWDEDGDPACNDYICTASKGGKYNCETQIAKRR